MKENWVYAYYQGLLPDLIEQDDRTQLDRYLTIYRQAFPETEQMKDGAHGVGIDLTTRRRWTNWTRNTVRLFGRHVRCDKCCG